ncbi:MAG: outer membrane beta-barrel protein [Treponema sp.]|jgi:opacity protein-like surface antigen|nr:outer membrane beta-barrel protein [Treponema sp.]
MKKFMLLSVLAAVAVGGAFAAPEFKVSAGAGGYFASDFGGGAEASSGGETMSIKTPYFGGGGFAFLDATYVEVSLGVFGGGGTVKYEVSGESEDSDMSVMGLDIGLLGKYPFAVSEKLSVFPLLGITYRVMLSVKDEDGDQVQNSDGDDAAGDFSALWFKFGGGLDISFTDHVYMRGEALYGLRLANTFEKDLVDQYESPGVDTKTLLGHGLDIKIALGYRF